MSTPADQITPNRSTDSFSTSYQRLLFVIGQLLGEVITIVPVRVVSVTGAGSLNSCPYVDVQPLLDQQTGAGESVPHETLYTLPAWRMQAGGSAVILDPVAGDVGLALVAYRDSSPLVAADQDSPGSLQGGSNTYLPGSRAMFDWSNGFYLGGWLNGEVSQYVQFLVSGSDPAGIKIVSSGGDVTVNGVTIDTDGNVDTDGDVTSSGEVKGDTLYAGNGATGSFEAESGQTITVENGIITNIS